MAYDLFAIPGMSSECERVFSRAKKMITDERWHLSADTIEADQCLKNWLRNNVVSGYGTMDHTMEAADSAAADSAAAVAVDD